MDTKIPASSCTTSCTQSETLWKFNTTPCVLFKQGGLSYRKYVTKSRIIFGNNVMRIFRHLRPANYNTVEADKKVATIQCIVSLLSLISLKTPRNFQKKLLDWNGQVRQNLACYRLSVRGDDRKSRRLTKGLSSTKILFCFSVAENSHNDLPTHVQYNLV